MQFTCIKTRRRAGYRAAGRAMVKTREEPTYGAPWHLKSSR